MVMRKVGWMAFQMAENMAVAKVDPKGVMWEISREFLSVALSVD